MTEYTQSIAIDNDALAEKPLPKWRPFKSQLKKYKAEISEDKKASASVGVASGGLTTSNTYKLEHDYFYEYLKNNQHKYIIFDNLETIINNQPVIEALGAIITLIDDPLVLEMDVRFL